MSIGSEGNIFLKDVSEVEQQNSVDFFKIVQSHKLAWHSVTSLALLSGSKMIAGYFFREKYKLTFSYRNEERSGPICQI